MADILRARPENQAGAFFVDDSCISCGACWRHAPKHYASHEIHTFAYVMRQPEGLEEERVMREALTICPVQAIGERHSR
jgi:ferredoxin